MEGCQALAKGATAVPDLRRTCSNSIIATPLRALASRLRVHGRGMLSCHQPEGPRVVRKPAPTFANGGKPLDNPVDASPSRTRRTVQGKLRHLRVLAHWYIRRLRVCLQLGWTKRSGNTQHHDKEYRPGCSGSLSINFHSVATSHCRQSQGILIRRPSVRNIQHGNPQDAGPLGPVPAMRP